ncbi:MAG: hypothetical protein JXA90_06420, partial [Planctomycetes bacterium]|nr:hypothetical protein [Planctomycetota bacterium]
MLHESRAERHLRSFKRRLPGRGVSIACLVTMAALARMRSLSAETAGPADSPWFERCLVGMEVGPTGAQFGHSDKDDARYAARFDGAEIVRRCVAASSEYVVIWARDGDYAYYDSEVALKCPGLGSRDVLRQTVEEARKHRLPVIAYCVV